MAVPSTPPPPLPPRAVRLVAGRIRLHAVRMVARQGLGYLGQALSSAELMAALFTSYLRAGLDHFVLSPGHYAIAVYAAAAETGLLEPGELDTYGEDGSMLEAIGTERSPVADISCGSLGQGLSAAVGLALADRLRGVRAQTYALVSDGELQEGQVWEAAMFAAHHGLDRLVVLLDRNNSQVDGPVDGITAVEPVIAKWAAFGWDAERVDGHDAGAVLAALGRAVASPRPAVIVADTSTRHGLDCLPADADGHFIKLPPELADRAVAELEAAITAGEGAA
ncbi:MAG TPA: 1-deoxy-D-xylulose-5-phosphate synthase N-terminal domain-containing protein [Actinomycetes bacterium]|jgi:transketolase|nr:1-deoxy-D-xylulose-5-phosphate synthase N-terminal domain-containing protein [Actinomycetes bacterium]